MLQGKPAGENENVTMNAIRGILCESDSNCVDAAQHTPSQAKKISGVSAEELTLRPIKKIETKIGNARFTSVPEGVPAAEVEAISRVQLRSLTDKSRVETPRVETTMTPEPAQEPAQTRSSFRMPQLKLPEISVGAIARHITPRRAGIALLIGLVAWRPALIAAFVLCWFVGVVAAFMLLGADRVWSFISWMVVRLSGDRDGAEERVLAWLDTVAIRWDAVLDRFPDGSVDGLYMPDFANRAEAQRLHEEAVNRRFNNMSAQG